MAITEIELIRHGSPVGGNRYRGNSIDDPLSEKGWQQMRQAIGDRHDWNLVVSSPLQRCLAFAQEVSTKHKIELLVDDRFREIGFGIWEGKNFDDIMGEDPDSFKNFYQDPVKYQPRDAEDLDRFQQRVAAALDDLLTTQQGKKILVVAHAGVIRASITHIIQAPVASMYRLSIGNAAIIRIRDDGIRPPTIMLP